MTASARPAPRPASVHGPLAPIFIGLRICLHLLITALVIFVVVRAVILPISSTSWVIAVAIVLLASYSCGALLTRETTRRIVQLGWLLLVTVEVLGLVLLTPDASFLVFPLFFLQLHLLRSRWGVTAALVSTLITVEALATHNGWNPGAVLGPFIGAAVAIVIGLGYRALYREAEDRQRLIDDLLATRHELAARERETGILEERARLAREIHDTVAQGLSSIQLLLHAAERDSGTPAALDHVRLARETAAADLAETRRFISELTPPALDQQTLPNALGRLAETASRDGITVSFHLSGEAVNLPMRLETALLRIAQAALSNVRHHADARRAEITLTYLEDWVGLDVVDDGKGFDPQQAGHPSSPTDGRASFGLIAMRQRVDQLGGTLTIESAPGAGAAIAASFDLSGDNE